MVKQYTEQPFIGQLDHRIAIYQNTTIDTSTGEDQESEVLLCNAMAQYKDRSDTLTQDDKVLHVNTREYIIRYRKDVYDNRLSLVVRIDNSDYRVYSVVEMGRNKFLKITCTLHE